MLLQVARSSLQYHSRRETRDEGVRQQFHDRQIGATGPSNYRWMVGATFADIVNPWGLIVAWEYAATHVSDTALHG